MPRLGGASGDKAGLDGPVTLEKIANPGQADLLGERGRRRPRILDLPAKLPQQHEHPFMVRGAVRPAPRQMIDPVVDSPLAFAQGLDPVMLVDQALVYLDGLMALAQLLPALRSEPDLDIGGGY